MPQQTRSITLCAIQKLNSLFPLENPGIVSIPAGFLFAFLGSVVGARNRRPDEEAEFEQMQFRAYTGHGVDGSVAHD